MIIRRVGPLSFAKLSGMVYAIMGLIFGGIVSLIALAGGFASNTSEGAGLSAMVGVGAVVVFPIFYGLIGFLAMLIGAWLYNVVAGIVGGVEVDVQ